MMMRYMLPSLCRWEPMFVIIFGMLWKKLVCFCIRCPTLGIIMFLGQYICVWVIIHSWASFWVWVTLITRYQNQSDPSSLLRFILIQASFRRIFIPVHLLCFISLNLFHHLLPFDLLFITIVNYLVRTSSLVHHDLILDFPSWIVLQSHQSELGFLCFYLRFKLISSILSTDSLIWVISESFIWFRSRFLVSDQSWSCYPIDWGIGCVSPPAEFVVRRSLLGVRCVAEFDLCWSFAALFRLISSFSELIIFFWIGGYLRFIFFRSVLIVFPPAEFVAELIVRRSSFALEFCGFVPLVFAFVRFRSELIVSLMSW